MMDDTRLEWIKDRVFQGLAIDDFNIFEEFLTDENGIGEKELDNFLNESQPPDDSDGGVGLHFWEETKELQRDVYVKVEITSHPDDDGGDVFTETILDKYLDPSAISRSGVDLSGGNLEMLVENDRLVVDWGGDQIESAVAAEKHHDDKRKGKKGKGSQPHSEPNPKYEIRKVKEAFIKTRLHVCRGQIPAHIAETRCIYFLRSQTGVIPTFASLQEANELMPTYLDYGVLNGHALLMLEQLLGQVFMPLFSHHAQKNDLVDQLQPSLTFEKHQPGSTKELSRPTTPSMSSDADDGTALSSMGAAASVPESRNKAMLRDEFAVNMQKFHTSVTRTIQQIEGGVRLHVPELPISDHMTENVRNSDLIESLETVVSDWSKRVASALESQLRKTPQGNGPLAEIEFWRERNASLSALVEQLKTDTVKKYLSVLQKADSVIVQNFEIHRAELSNFHTEAKDNVRFLSTLERHFKNITYGANFHVVLETIPSMMNALRMVWIISRHYNRDERMVPLMERIAWELGKIMNGF
jgi:hypothetical protein